MKRPLIALVTLIAFSALPIACGEVPPPPAETIEPAREALVDLHVEVLAPEGTQIPHFKVDAAWPNMPSNMILGQIPGLSVDKDDTIWIAHRPHSLTPFDVGLVASPQAAEACCQPAPTIVKFAKDGSYLGGWGSPETGPVIDGVNQWPKNIHGLYVDADQTLWIAGNGDGDHVVLNFTADGDFIRKIGNREQTDGNNSQDKLGNPSDVYHDGELILIADGYVNKRVISFHSEDGEFADLWGAYGNDPSGGSRQGVFDQSQASATNDGGPNPEADTFGDIVHCITSDGEGLIFVCDRRNNRAQVFRRNEDGSTDFVRNIVIDPNTGGTRTVTDIAFSPDGKFIYVADMMNSRINVLDRKSYERLAIIGRIGRQPGQFTWLHSIDVDSEGNLYATEVGTGRRVQKLVLQGVY